jgi:hypothetical protein
VKSGLQACYAGALQSEQLIPPFVTAVSFACQVSLFSQASLDEDPPILHFLSEPGQQIGATIPSYWLRFGSSNLFLPDWPGTVISVSQVARCEPDVALLGFFMFLHDLVVFD